MPLPEMPPEITPDRPHRQLFFPFRDESFVGLSSALSADSTQLLLADACSNAAGRIRGKTSSTRLANGFHTNLIDCEGLLITGEIRVAVGSSDEINESEYGTAHLLEHAVNFIHADEPSLMNTLVRNAVDFNSETHREETIYRFSCNAGSLLHILRAYARAFFECPIHEAVIERQKQGILNEIVSKKETSIQELRREILTHVWGDSLAHFPIGSKESLGKITHAAVSDFRDRHYQPSRMSLSLSGTGVSSRAQEIFSIFEFTPPRGEPMPDVESPSFDFQLENEQRIRIYKGDGERSLGLISIVSSAVTPQILPGLQVLLNAIAGDESSLLFALLRDQKSLVYGVVSDVHSFYRGGGCLDIFFTADRKNFTPALTSALEAIGKVEDGQELSEEALSRGKLRYFRDTLMRLDSPQEVVSLANIGSLRGVKMIDPTYLVNPIASFTSSEARALLAGILSSGSLCISGIE